MSRFTRSAIASLWVLLALRVTETNAQTAGLDTTRVYELDNITRTAERTPTVVARTTSATTTVSADAMRYLPARSVTDWLAFTPGISFVDLDGLGYDSQPIVRGFYGGGEAEYVLLQIDGVPVGDGESGLVNWQLLPLRAIRRIEIVRGGSSALFGDAALGAVLNIVTDADRPGGVLSVSAGSRVPIDAEIDFGGRIAAKRLRLFGKYARVDGYRAHAARDLGSAGGSLSLVSNETTRFDLMTLHFLSDAEVPGPLFEDIADSDPSESLAFFRYDRREESSHILGVRGSHDVGRRARLSFRATGKLRLADITETVPLSADFADTQQRDLTDLNLGTNVQLTADLGRFAGRLTAGIDASGSRITTDYSTLLAGSLADYLEAVPPLPAPAAAGDGSRHSAAGYVHLAAEPVERLRVTAGARFDVIHDSFSADGAEAITTDHTALSPKVGANYRFLSRTGAVGNLYVNASRSFKAPTLDQLYDQRAVPVPFPPFRVSLSSSSLEPQTGTSFEVGLYQQIEPSGSDLAAEISLALYQIDMKDEIDFDLQQLSYRNIGESRHRGLESRLSIYYGSLASTHVGYTYQGTTLEYGDYSGNFVKAIPRDVVTASFSVEPAPLQATLTVQSSQRIYLDDANTIRLPGHTSVSLRVGYDFGRFTVTGDVLNVLDGRFSTTGFPDPAGSGQVFLYPTADRQVRVTVDMKLR